MSEIHSQASVKRWANVSKKKRFERMSAVAKAKNAKMTKEERKALALKMVRARQDKK